MFAREFTAGSRSSLTASTVGALVLLVGCHQDDDGALTLRKDSVVMKSAAASEDVPVVVISARREADSQDRSGKPRTQAPRFAGQSGSAPHF